MQQDFPLSMSDLQKSNDAISKEIKKSLEAAKSKAVLSGDLNAASLAMKFEGLFHDIEDNFAGARSEVEETGILSDSSLERMIGLFRTVRGLRQSERGR